MKNAKFIQILKTLNKDEFKQLGKFVRSPIFNTNKTIIKLYDILKPAYPEFNNGSIEKEKIFKKLYPAEKFKEKKIRNISSEFLVICQKYLTYCNLSKKPLNQMILLLEELYAKGAANLFKYFSKEALQQLESGEIKGSDYYFNKYLLSNTINSFNRARINDKLASNTQDEIDNLTFTILISSFKLFSIALDESFYFNILYDYKILPVIFRYVSESSNNLQLTPLIKVLYDSANLRNNNTEENFENLKITKNTFRALLDKDTKSSLYNTIYNFAITHENESNKYFSEIYEISKELLEEEIIIEGGFIPESFFINHVSSCIKLKLFEEAEQFISKYRLKLSIETRDNIVNLSYINLKVAEGKFREALQHINKFKTSNRFYNIQAMQLICYYELNYDEHIPKAIKTYRQYLKNVKIPEEFKETRKHFLYYFAKLYNIKLLSNAGKKKKLIKDLRNAGIFQGHEWLLKKANELNSVLPNKKARSI